MNVLWITNIPFPPICKEMNLSVPVMGGWMYSSAQRLVVEKEISLAVATVYPGKTFIDKEINGIRYFLLPLNGNSNSGYLVFLEKYWIAINSLFQPDITHLHGTEYPYGLAYLKVSPICKTVVSIQGLLSVYARYYLAGIGWADIVRNITLRDVLKQGILYQGQRSFQKGGKMELEIIRRVDAVIGRTSWDEAHIRAINPDVHYYFCNETLRGEFYKHTWDYEKCEKYSVFISQAGYPIKGLHQVLKALPLVLRSFPDTKIYVGGLDIVNDSSWMNRLKRTGYGKYIKGLLRKNSLAKHVTFLGMLDEQQMCKRYLLSNVFVCPSSIENSPNSLGEAQMMGVPCIASYVGGVVNMMDGYERGFMYRFEEVEMLAELICDVFRCNKYTGNSGSDVAHRRHDSTVNAVRTIEIYKAMVY